MDRSMNDNTAKFILLTENLLSSIHNNIDNEKFINSYLNDLNELDYGSLVITNSEPILLVLTRLCTIVPPTESSLVKNTCQFLINLLRTNVTIHGQSYEACQLWLMNALKFSQPLAWHDILSSLQSFLSIVQIDNINLYLQDLFNENNLLMIHLIPQDNQWTELNFQAIRCLEGIIVNKKNCGKVSQKFKYMIKDIILNITSSTSYPHYDTQYYSKILSLCLRILCIIITDKLISITSDLIGEILGVVQAFLFYGIKNYLPIKAQMLRPAAMNLPEPVHIIPKCKNLKNHKSKPKRNIVKKSELEMKNNIQTENKGISKYSSDSDTSDTEMNNSTYMESKVRLEVIRLLQALVESTNSREIFGYWPQIVATGSRNDARVLTNSILKEPVCKVRQAILIVLTELLVGARSFLIHAEDVEQTSFITFFGTVSLMVKELHLTLSLVISTEKNAAVLTHAMKCATALIEGTPYTRLKSGLVTKLITNCKSHLSHKDPTVKVAILSIFEALASCDPITPEILNILAQGHTLDNELEKLCIGTSSASDIGTEEEEVDIHDAMSNSFDSNKHENLKENNISLIVQICLEHISNKTMNVPVRLQALKLIGRMAFSTGNLIFSHMEVIITTLISALQDSEVQVNLHACRVLEIMSECLANMDLCHNNTSLFWNSIFESIVSLTQHTQFILREAACDCLGSIGTMITQLSRERTVLIVTILFSAVRDEESAVRAAGVRALGMLVTLHTLEEDTGFLMDLVNTVSLVSDDQNLGVRIKGAWTLANLCDCLSRLKSHEEMEPLPLDILLPQLYHVSVKAAKDKDKVKCNAVRAVGTILYLCPDKQILKDTTSGLDALINCAVVGNNMKVRWNACHALGLVLSHNPDNILPSSWRDQVFPALCALICHSPNFKVRTNAAWALSSCNSYGKYIITLWKSIALGFENSQHVPSYVEYPHRDALIQQLCLTLSHIAIHTQQSELLNLWTEIGEHVEDISSYMKQYQETIVPEKVGDLIKAKAQLEKHVKCSSSSEEHQIAQTLANIFERTTHYDNMDVISIV